MRAARSVAVRLTIPGRLSAVVATTALVASGVAALALAPAAHAEIGPICFGLKCRVIYYYTGQEDTFTVPTGITSIDAVVTGAPGGPARYPTRGGEGGVTTGTVKVTPGDILRVNVGQAGTKGGTTRTFGGGGPVVAGNDNAGSGGGRSSLATTSETLLIAGGGGGSSDSGGTAIGGSGGGAKGAAGSHTSDPYGGFSYSDAGGGTEAAGGTAGRSSDFPSGGDGDSPTVGDGGTGSDYPDFRPAAGGGGGGGYHGGGGGSFWESGGGGSGYVSPAVPDGSMQTGGSAFGSVEIFYDKFPTTTTLSASPSTSKSGTSVTLTAKVTSASGTPDGTVSFADGESVIDGCAGATLSDGAVSCQVTFTPGSHTLKAEYTGSYNFSDYFSESVYAQSNDTLTYSSISDPTLTTTSPLPDATVDAAYSQQLSANNGIDYSYAIDSGSLPDGLTLSPDGLISGTPTSAGTSTVSIKVSAEGQSNVTSLVLAVNKASQTISFTSSAPTDAQVDGATYTVSATGGASGEPVTFTGDDNCTVTGATVMFIKHGTCVITADQAGDHDYTAADPQTQQVTVAAKATTTSLALSSATVVHGQPVTATATVTGTTAGEVVFLVDGQVYDTQDVDAHGTATSRNLAANSLVINGRHVTGVRPIGLTVGSHTVTATFTPTNSNTEASSETVTGSSLTVDPATSTTSIKVNVKTLVATVSVDAPSTDTPTGSVTFLVGGKEVGTAPIVDGVATLDYAAPAGRAVAATYSGRGDANENTEVSSSSASTARSNPTVTARVTSSKGKSKAGWYSRPATVRFTCRAGSDAVTACPTAVTVGRNGITTVKRTVLAKDGGVVTINVTVKVDRSRPTVRITGVKAGGIYGALPSTRCAASDKVSGVTSCRIVHKAKGSKIKFTAVATDRAGNTTKKTVTVRRSPALITGAKYGGTLPVVKLGKGYTLIVTGKARPSYVYAAPSPARPTGNGGPFTKIGKNRWAYSVVFTKNLRGHSTWSFGVKTGKKTVTVKVRVKR